MLEGEDYGEFKTHSNSHLDYWDGLATSLKMPKHCSHDYHPRGESTIRRRSVGMGCISINAS
jgi:hypothetical protein